MELLLNGGRVEDEVAKEMNATEIVLNKRHHDDISSEEKVQEIYILQ